MKPKRKDFYIKSAGQKVYAQFIYPKKIPAPAIILTHGLRSYFPGFGDMFAKAMVRAGYMAVKFHFVGTGNSDGRFEQKDTATMLKNLEDVIDFVHKQKEVRGMAVMGRSNAACLATLHGPDARIRGYAFLGAPAYYSPNLAKFIRTAKIQGKYFVHKTFKRPHTKGPGRLPLSFVDELKKYDQPLLVNIKKMKPVIFLQSRQDEAVPIEEGHFAYWQKHLPQPRKLVLVDATCHSFCGKKRLVIAESIKWFKRFLPV